MNKCEQTKDALADYRTDALGAGRSRDIQRHVSECAECAEELRVLDGVLALVESNAADYEPPAGLWNGVYNRITDSAAARRGLRLGVRDWLLKPMHAAGTAIAVLAVLAGIVFGVLPSDNNPPVFVSAQNAEYIQGHALYAAQAPLADHAGYLSVVAESGKTR